MIEILIFWGIPLLFMMMSMQSPFFQNWRFFLVLSLAGYLALWCFPLCSDLFKAFLPKEINSYAKGIAFTGPLIGFFIALYQTACNLSGHSGGGYHLPKGKNLLIPILGLLSGFVASGLAGYAICLTPLHASAASDAVFQERAVSRVCTLTVFIDKISLQKYSAAARRKALLSRVASWKKTPPPEKKDNKDDSANKAEKKPQQTASASLPEKHNASQKRRDRYGVLFYPQVLTPETSGTLIANPNNKEG